MKDKELSGEARLKEALKLSDQTYVGKHPKAKNEIQYSAQYLKKIRQLTQRSKNPLYKYIGIMGKSVAGIAAAILIIFCCSVLGDTVKGMSVGFFDIISSAISENPLFKNPDYQGTQSTDSQIEPQETESSVEPHEHEFTVLYKTDSQKHYYACGKSGCKEVFAEVHKYIHKPGTYHLECEVCGRIPK